MVYLVSVTFQMKLKSTKAHYSGQRKIGKLLHPSHSDRQQGNKATNPLESVCWNGLQVHHWMLYPQMPLCEEGHYLQFSLPWRQKMFQHRNW